MVVDMRVNGLKIIWRAWVSTFGMMDVCTKVNIKTIKNMDLVCTLG